MERQYNNNNKGALWISPKDKTDEDEDHPKLTGSIMVGNEEYRIAIFKNGDKNTAMEPDYNIALINSIPPTTSLFS